MIQLHNVSRTFRMGDETVHALDKVSLDIKEGEFVAIMGPSGSGKSTFLHLIGGLDTPDGGTIAVDGHLLHTMSDKQKSRYRNRTIGFIFQDFNLQNMYTALENVMMPMYFAKMHGDERKKKAQEMLHRVGLSHRMHHKPTELSGGQRQRVAIARALAMNPKIILADEPTGNLDSKTGRDIIAFLKKLTSQGMTVVIVTHDADAAQQASRVIHIRDGHIG